MGEDAATTVLRLLAEGRLTVDEADRLLDALDPGAGDGVGRDGATSPAVGTPGAPSRPRALRVRVREGGRQVVNLQVPVSLAASAARFVPGLSEDQLGQLRDAIAAGTPMTIVDVEDDDTSVLVSLE